MYAKKEKAYPAYVSKHNLNHEKQVILLLIPYGKGHEAKSEGRWHYFAVKKLSELLRRIASKHHGGFSCLNCPHSFATKSKLESHKKVCENKDFLMQLCLLKTLKYWNLNHYQKSDKVPFIIYADLECIIEKIDGCKIILKIHLQQK